MQAKPAVQSRNLYAYYRTSFQNHVFLNTGKQPWKNVVTINSL